MAQSNLPRTPPWTPRRVMLATLFIVFIILAFWLLYRFHVAVMLLFVAIIIGTAMRPAVEYLARRGLSPLYGQVLIYLLLITALVLFLWLALPLLLEQATAVTQTLTRYYFQLRTLLLSSPSDILQNLGFQLSPSFEVESLMKSAETPPATPEETEETVDRVAQVFGAAGLALKGLFSLVAVFFMAFFWTLENERATRSLLLLAPQPRREEIREIIDEIESRLGGFLWGQGLLSLTIGLLSLAAYLLIGLPNALVLAIIAGITEMIPVVGPVLGAIPALILAAGDPSKIIWVLVSVAVIQSLENYILVPRIMGHSAGVHPLLTILALATLGSLFGLIGALLAVPASAVVQYLINYFVFDPQKASTAQLEGRDRLSYLRLQAQEITQDLQKQGMEKVSDEGEGFEPVKEAIEALALDLDRLLDQNISEEKVP